MVDGFNVIAEEGFKNSNAALVREAISLLEAQGHECAGVKERLHAMVTIS